MSKFKLAYRSIFTPGMDVIFANKYHPLNGVVGSVVKVTEYKVKVRVGEEPNSVVLFTKPQHLQFPGVAKGNSDAYYGSPTHEQKRVRKDNKQNVGARPNTGSASQATDNLGAASTSGDSKVSHLSANTGFDLKHVLSLKAADVLIAIKAGHYTTEQLALINAETKYKTVRKEISNWFTAGGM